MGNESTNVKFQFNVTFWTCKYYSIPKYNLLFQIDILTRQERDILDLQILLYTKI